MAESSSNEYSSDILKFLNKLFDERKPLYDALEPGYEGDLIRN